MVPNSNKSSSERNKCAQPKYNVNQDGNIESKFLLVHITQALRHLVTDTHFHDRKGEKRKKSFKKLSNPLN